jgi:hypothetical protein
VFNVETLKMQHEWSVIAKRPMRPLSKGLVAH